MSTKKKRKKKEHEILYMRSFTEASGTNSQPQTAQDAPSLPYTHSTRLPPRVRYALKTQVTFHHEDILFIAVMARA